MVYIPRWAVKRFFPKEFELLESGKARSMQVEIVIWPLVLTMDLMKERRSWRNQVDAEDLKSSEETRIGSTPIDRTMIRCTKR